MDDSGFWSLIDRVRSSALGNLEQQCENLETALKSLAPSDCRSAAIAFESAYIKAYTWRLWGAAYLINGGCSDDSFMDFRASLILQGRTVFEKAVVDPDSLADLDREEEDWTFEGFQYAVIEALEEVCGEDVADDLPKHPGDPAGSEWTEDDLPKLLPRLHAKYAMPNDA